MALTPEQIQHMNQITGLNKPVTPAQGTSQSRAQQVLSIAKQPQDGQSPGYGNQVADAAKGGLSRIGQGIQEAKPDGTGNVGNLVEGVGKVLGGAAQAVTSPLAPVLKPVGDVIDKAGKALADTPYMQAYGKDTVSLPADEPTAPERVAGTIADYANAAGVVAGGPELADQIGNLSKSIKTGLKSDPNIPPKQPATGNPAETNTAQVKTKAQAAVNSATEDWKRPINQPGTKFNNAKAIAESFPEVPKFLAEQGINPSAHIEDGKYTTTETAEALRSTAAKMSNDTLRPSLQMADYTTPKTSVPEIIKASIKNVQKDGNMTEGDKTTAINNLGKEADALKAKYPNGMSLTDMHDSKITYSKNAGYSPIKDPNANIKASGNRALASAFQKAVESKAPDSVPVGDFNKYASQYHKAADYLEALNGKIAPITIGQQIARGAAKFGGAALGAKFGGGVVSEFAGYQIGKALEHAAENMTNPMRATYLSNLETTNPEAFTKVKAYLEAHSSGNTGTPRLSPPTSTQLPAAPIRGRQ